ncbi:unnamed protein product [Nippostrongylus brasiliensis]|uniref:MoCF_biosynth domain-containing protein n=1 Tax=Nippostrongylus brasiliensis TaxID=27835 RepID=A0A0N4YXE7_NIPBR|nr:unnamed protein product [Nippostrongylus brasiliensis]
MDQMKEATSDSERRSVVARPRQSPWPAVPMDEALALLECMDVPTCVKYVPITAVRVGHVLAERIVALTDVPEVRMSIKDGYAVRSTDPIGVRKVIGSSTAGSPFLQTVGPGECVRISTGAAVPDGADAVVMNVEEFTVIIDVAVKPGQDVRMPGSDIAKGELLLDAGCVLGSAEVGVLAGCGKRSLVECTAEEIPLLIALFGSLGFKPIDAGIATDKRECLIESIKVSFQYANVLVTSGGVSMGEKDLMKDVLMNDFGFQIHFGRVWMKPGLPTTFATGVIGGEKKFVFALPGNPVSSWVAAQLFAVPLLRKAAGYSKVFQRQFKVQLAEDLVLDARPEYRRAWLQHGNNIPIAITTGNQISSRLMSLSGANVLLKIPAKSEHCSVLPVGEVVDALWLGTM